MPRIVLDPASTSLQNHFALVMTKKASRQRFPAGCVRLAETEADALQQANPAENLYPAIVYGPSTSSEGTKIYYLVRWLAMA